MILNNCIKNFLKTKMTHLIGYPKQTGGFSNLLESLSCSSHTSGALENIAISTPTILIELGN